MVHCVVHTLRSVKSDLLMSTESCRLSLCNSISACMAHYMVHYMVHYIAHYMVHYTAPVWCITWCIAWCIT